MKSIIILLLSLASVSMCAAQTKEDKPSQPDKTKKLLLVEASCGQCKFGLPGNDCKLAVRIDGQSYFVDGANIDEHGDAHAEDGFCNAIRKAKVQGEVKDNRFKATYFKLLPEEQKKKQQ